jgi:hypothetical protein
MRKVLHLSHHYGCLKDHQYICSNLGLELESVYSHWDTVLPKGCYGLASEQANEIWNKNEDYFKSFDYIITSDTAPLSRIILQNIDNFSGKLIVWICNRFDYNIEWDSSYYELIKKYSNHEKVKLIPYTEFEKVWLNRFNIDTKYETIKPIGLVISEPLSKEEQYSIGFDGDYEMSLGGGDVLVSRYHNDNIFQSSKSICESFGLVANHAKYRGSVELEMLSKLYQCFLIFPDAYSKFTAFELMQLKMPVILPSENLLLKLYKKPNYFFSTGITPNTVKYCEWYNEYYEKFAVYFEDLDGIPDAVQMVKDHKDEIYDIMNTISKIHTEKTLNQWREVYD